MRTSRTREGGPHLLIFRDLLRPEMFHTEVSAGLAMFVRAPATATPPRLPASLHTGYALTKSPAGVGKGGGRGGGGGGGRRRRRLGIYILMYICNITYALHTHSHT